MTPELKTMTISTRRADPATEQDPRWAAVATRDRRADGTFYYSVRTTGVYCRPSCGSRRANPRNVSFHLTTTDAERAGFRPCRRCRPDEPPLEQRLSAKVADICRTIETADTMPSLAALADRAGLSPYHFHRVFKAVTGVTPRAYAAAHRTQRIRAELEKGPRQ
jgi:AraC family transcriptional regulator, regulatory protein of adaptative response / methylated-DNA-[protein]-cysteine methyltransferase